MSRNLQRTSLTEDPWLARMLGCPAYHLLIGTDLSQGEDDRRRICRMLQGRHGFFDVRCDVGQLHALPLLQSLDFYVVDTNVVLERPLQKGKQPASDVLVREARHEDVTAVRAIARNTITMSRFHLDPRIPLNVAHRLKESWAENFFEGKRGDAMVVAEHDGTIVGFNQLMRNDIEGVLTIDLIGVQQDSLRMGIGRLLVHGGERLCSGACNVYKVGTQVANVASLRFYQRLGFTIQGATYVLHRHHTPDDQAAGS